MNKVIYKDQDFSYDVKEDQHGYKILSVYEKREGFWSIFSPYRKLAHSRMNPSSLEGALRERLERVLIEAYPNAKNLPTMVIDSSKEITQIYESI